MPGLENFGGGRGGAGGAADTFATDFTLSQKPGHTLGRFGDGDLVHAAGKTAVEVLLDAAVEQILPTYVPAALSLSMSVPQFGEVGETVSNQVTAIFQQNDAGALTVARILRDLVQLGNVSSNASFYRTDTTVRVLGGTEYQVVADYAAGPVKLVQPAGTPDTRPAQVRNPNAPQAAQTGFQSAHVLLYGRYKVFYGPAAAAPASSADARALPSRLSNAGNVFELVTGTTATHFPLVLPPGVSLVQVIDLDALNANLTAHFLPAGSLAVNDAAGQPVQYALRMLTVATPYPSSHRLQITISQ